MSESRTDGPNPVDFGDVIPSRTDTCPRCKQVVRYYADSGDIMDGPVEVYVRGEAEDTGNG